MAAIGLSILGLLTVRYQNRKRKTISFSEKIVLITGGSRGLGLILAKQMAREGAKVIICARSPDQLEKARHAIELQSVYPVSAKVCDISDLQQVENLFAFINQHYGRLDILINNASIIQVGPATEMNRTDYEQALAINFWGTFNTTTAALPIMLREKAGRIANITSVGSVVAVPHLLPYTIAKFASRGFSEGLTAEMAQHGIYVTTVIPGLMRTGSFLNAFFKGKTNSEFNWFSLLSTFPFISMDAEKAADEILKAIRLGKPVITLGIQTRTGVIIYKLFPGYFARFLSKINRLLPKSPSEKGIQTGNRTMLEATGKNRKTWVSNSVLLELGNRAAKRFNQI
jgi:short-subunit dehydrogenase